LGVDRNASIEDIKKAYRELVKKYHPDRYQDNPLKDLADEKLAEINEAYEYIMENYEREQMVVLIVVATVILQMAMVGMILIFRG